MYFEFDDSRRIHSPYTDAYYRRKSYQPVQSGFRPRLEGPTLQLPHPQLEERHVRLVYRRILGK